MAGYLADAFGLRGVGVELGGQTRHSDRAYIGLVVFSVNQVIQHPMAKCALRSLHRRNAEQVEHCTQHADAAANHRTPVVFHAVEF